MLVVESHAIFVKHQSVLSIVVGFQWILLIALVCSVKTIYLNSGAGLFYVLGTSVVSAILNLVGPVRQLQYFLS